MSRYLKGSIYKRFNRFLADVISGHAGVPTMIAVFGICALVLLGYVTTQIYSSVLAERISTLEELQVLHLEKIYTITSNRTSLCSRERIVSYCERNLGMVEADCESLKRIAVDMVDSGYPEHGEFATKRTFVPEVLGATTRKSMDGE